jgi:hypothetical protein
MVLGSAVNVTVGAGGAGGGGGGGVGAGVFFLQAPASKTTPKIPTRTARLRFFVRMLKFLLESVENLVIPWVK